MSKKISLIKGYGKDNDVNLKEIPEMKNYII